MLIVEKDPKSVAAESYRMLRTNIKYSSFDKEVKKVLFTSSIPGEGKSTTASNVALAFAQEEKKVILIDCDLRKSNVHKVFNISNRKGLTDALLSKGHNEMFIVKHNEYLDILPAGVVPPNPSEMLSSKAMENLLIELEGKYDVIIIDSPPVKAVTDAQILSRLVDGVVLVVRTGFAKKESVKETKKELEKVGGKIIGIALNRVQDAKGKYYYYYG
ncbi:CpsD/CapB family tyrosine-protein kinase [uncultured Clostridium sp.]|uniref:CpsD/CapB family tyrosine-protein kinase n=1 Tax=uncultured Clostridium sp. TaxID=59620 RepID=UPI002611FCB3|nr:CpsD/CapB family tyrosine-protein kinase [uncultured Clostridium sp.]